MNKRLVMLLIIDGFGISNKKIGNAIYNADTSNLDYIKNKYPSSVLNSSGKYVGLEDNLNGNSNVGHYTIGSGRIVLSDLVRINNSIKDLSFYNNKEFIKAINNAKRNKSNLHLMGLLSRGNVHSNIDHLFELLKVCKYNNFYNVYIDGILDGRDTYIKDGIKYIKELEEFINKEKIGIISSISGRYYAMDRDKRYSRIKKYYDIVVNGKGNATNDISKTLNESYKNNVTDEFFVPTIIKDKDDNINTIKEKDSVIFFNFRADRAREITEVLTDNNFKKFKTKKLNLYFVCATEYDKSNKNVKVAFKKEKIKNTLGEYISKKGLKQLRIAETEKYAHVTFFFNGGKEKPFRKEDRILISSPKVKTYDLKPEMSTYKITNEVVKSINSNKYNFILMNIACTDMVGHTGNYKQTIKAVEAADKSIKIILDEIIKNNGILIITSDHGNCEDMLNNNKIVTSHTNNKVPFIICNYGNYKLKDGNLYDIAPTILDILNIKKPKEMTGNSLIIRK